MLAVDSSLVRSNPLRLLAADIGGGACMDVDDVVAICMAHALMDKGEVDIKVLFESLIFTESFKLCSQAIVHDAGIPEGIGAMSVLNHFYGRDDILLGAYKVQIC